MQTQRYHKAILAHTTKKEHTDMVITTEDDTVEIKLGNHVFDKRTDTFLNWDSLDPTTKQRLEALTEDMQTIMENLRATIIQETEHPKTNP